MSKNKTCPAPLCNQRIGVSFYYCLPHFNMLPKQLRFKLNEARKHGIGAGLVDLLNEARDFFKTKYGERKK